MIEPKDVIALYYQLSNPSTKAAITISHFDYKVIRTVEVNVPKMIRESKLLEPYSACTYPDNFAFKLIEKTMFRLVEAGIPQYHYDFLVNFEFKVLTDPEWEPSIFSLSDLEFGFVTWLISCGFAIGIFLAQLLYVFLKREARNLSALFAILQFVRHHRVDN